jgi:N-acylglucosamine-6-phosphate 2-epimerase
VGETGVYITPTAEAVRAVLAAGADMVAVDATARSRPEPLAALIEAAHAVGKPVLADCSSLSEAVAAQEAGADAVAPTLSGYTGGPVPREPDWALLEAMVRDCHVPVFMEGRIWSPAEARHALDLGAWAVVVGSAITRPQLITARFAEAVAAVV